MKNIFKKAYKGPRGKHLSYLTKKSIFGEEREVNMSIHPGRMKYGYMYDRHKRIEKEKENERR